MTRNGKVVPVSDIDTLTLEERIALVLEHLEKAEQLLPGLADLTVLERIHSRGRLRDGEEAAMHAILDAASRFPHYFTALAARDNGLDDSKFEAAPAKADLQRRAALARLSKALSRLAQRCEDTRTVLGARARSVTMSVYELGRAIADVDARFRDALAPATHYYSAPARARSKNERRTRVANGSQDPS